MADLPFTPAVPELAARLAACLDVEQKIPRAIDALGPIVDRDVVVVDGDGGRRAAQLAELGARVRALPTTPPDAPLAAADGSADVVVGYWSAFRASDGGAPLAAGLTDVDRVLRPGGRLLVVHDYGRDDVSRLRGDLPEYGTWSRRDGWYMRNGFRIRVVHCFWTFDTIEETRAFLGEVFGETGTQLGESLKRPRLSYNVAIYHRARGGAEPTA